MKRTAALLVLSIALWIAGSGAAWANMSPQQAQQVSDQILSQLIRQYGQPRVPYPDEPVSRVFNTLLPRAERHDVVYRILVIENKTVNAMALPDGRLVFFSGLLRSLPQNDLAPLAGVVGHEMTHVERHHADRKLTQMMTTQIGLSLLLGNSFGARLLGNLASNLLTSGYSRDMENEADRGGLDKMRAAGYDPNGMLTLFRMFIAMESGGSHPFPSHPKPTDRYNNTLTYLRENGIAIHEPPPYVASSTQGQGSLPRQPNNYPGAQNYPSQQYTPPPNVTANGPQILDIQHNGPGPISEGQTFSITARGTPRCNASFAIGNQSYPLQETSPGLYHADRTVQPQDFVENAHISVSLLRPDGRWVKVDSPQPVSLHGNGGSSTFVPATAPSPGRTGADPESGLP